MFTDIVGYTSLMGEDEEHAYGLLKKNRELQRPVIEKHHGEWLKEIGDGVLARFQTVSDAVYCALEIQKRCKQESSFQLRIGIHVGEVIVEDGDVFGDGVNIAARIESLAPDGGILVSESVHKNVINKKGINTKFFGEQKLRGVKEKVKVYQLKGFDSTSTGRIYQSPSSRRYILLAIFLALVIGLGYFFYLEFKDL